MKRLSMYGVVAALLLMTAAVVQAQSAPLAVPSAAGRGPHRNAVPFYVPSDLARDVRGPVFTVTTEADENGACDQTGTGLSLREALTACAAIDPNFTVYVPAGVYTLNSEIVPDFDGLMLVGEDPFTTVIESAPAARLGTTRLISFIADAQPLTVLNLTFRGGNAGPADEGGAVSVSGEGTAVTFTNVIFSGSNAGYGGALYFDVGDYPVSATIQYSAFTGNTAAYDGGAIYFQGNDTGGNALWIQNSLFTSNTAGLTLCDEGGGAIAAVFSAEGNAVSIDSTSFEFNSFTNNNCDGGAVFLSSNEASVAFNISYSDFFGNGGPGSSAYGGAVYVDNEFGASSISHSIFESNFAGYGGAVYDYRSYSVAIDSTEFYDNIASGDGGALYLTSGHNTSITYTTLMGNTAGSKGGAAYFDGDPSYISDTLVSGNSAGDMDGLNGFGGGLYVYNNGAILQRTLVEDNLAQNGPDCYVTGGGTPDPVVSLGDVGISDLEGCTFIPHASDQFDNLLLNGGFEFALIAPPRARNEAKPASWTLKNLSGDKRTCNTSGKFVTPYGRCAFVFTGGTKRAILSQNVDLLANTFVDGQTLILYAMGDGSKKSKVQVTVTATYTDTGLAKTTKKLLLKNSAVYAPQEISLDLTDGGLSKLQVTVTDLSTSGKFMLDRVYLFSFAGVVPRGERGAVLPPPAAPNGMRGSN